MKVVAALAKVPWKKLFRFLPGVIGVAGEIVNRNAEHAQADAFSRLEERQKEQAEAVNRTAARLNMVFWIAVAAAVFAIAAFVAALAR